MALIQPEKELLKLNQFSHETNYMEIFIYYHTIIKKKI